MKRFTKIMGTITLSLALVMSSLVVTPGSNAVIQAEETPEDFHITDPSLFHAEYVNGIYTITGFDGLYNVPIVVPYEINGIAVRAIDVALSGKINCLTVYLPDSLSIIGSKTFAATTVEYVKSYSNSKISEIMNQPIAGELESGFLNQPGRESSDIDTGNTDIPEETPVLSDSLPASLKIIEDYAFKDSKIKNLTVASKMDKIGSYAFANTSIFLDFTVSDTGSVSTIGDHAFYNSCIHNIVLRGSITSIGSYAFANCGNIIQVEVSSNTNYTLGEYAFSCAQIHNVYLSEGLTNIEKGTFEKCGNLEKVQLPQSLKNIGDDAFKDVPNLKEINIPADTTIASSAFEGVGDSTKKALAASGNTNALVLLGMSVVPTSTPAPVPVAAAIAPSTPAPAKINVGKAKLTSVKKKKGKAVLTWKKVKDASGYTIYKKVVKKGTKAKKAKKIKFVKVKNVSAKTTKLTIKLKKKATTSFYIKAFAKTKVNGKAKTVYGKASNVKKVKA